MSPESAARPPADRVAPAIRRVESPYDSSDRRGRPPARAILEPTMARDSAVTRVLLAMCDRAYDRKSWHGTNLRGALRSLSPKEAAWRPGRGRHNAWEIAVHCAYWKYVVIRALTGGRRGGFARKGSNWFVLPSDRSETAWKADLALLDATHRALRDAILALDPANLERPLPRKKTSRGALITGAAAHDLYHAGQIQLIKRMLPRRARSARGAGRSR